MFSAKNQQPTKGSDCPGNGGTVTCLGICEPSLLVVAMVAVFEGVCRFISILGHMKTLKHIQSLQN